MELALLKLSRLQDGAGIAEAKGCMMELALLKLSRLHDGAGIVEAMTIFFCKVSQIVYL